MNVMSSTPKVSIGLPVYNGERFLAEALDSLLAQTFTDFEVVISDNASSDATQSICEEYRRRDARVKYFRHDTNRGPGWNFNQAFELSHGEYFKWCAHDDVLAPTYLQRCVEVLDRDEGVVWVSPQATTIDGNGSPFLNDPAKLTRNDVVIDGREIHRFDPHMSSASASKRYAAILLHDHWVHDFFGLSRADAIRQTGLIRRFVGAEKTFLTELGLQGRFAEVPEVLFYSRIHDNRISQSASAQARVAQIRPESAGRSGVPDPIAAALAQIGVIYEAKISLPNRAMCFFGFARYVLQFRKWNKILREVVSSARPAETRFKVKRAAKESLANAECSPSVVSKVAD